MVSLNRPKIDVPVKFSSIVIPTSRELGKVPASVGSMLPVQLDGDLTHPEKVEGCKRCTYVHGVAKLNCYLLPPFENGNLMPSHSKGNTLLKNFTGPKNSLRT